MQSKQIDPNLVEIFTDGACSGNPGPGGWGAVLRFRGKEKSISGAEEDTTNNRMELTAVIKGLEALTRKCTVHVTTDSKYIQQGITQWIHGWKKKNWQTSNKKPVKNKDLWQQLDALVEQHDVHFCWVKGHSGHRENEMADELAREAIENLL